MAGAGREKDPVPGHLARPKERALVEFVLVCASIVVITWIAEAIVFIAAYKRSLGS